MATTPFLGSRYSSLGQLLSRDADPDPLGSSWLDDLYGISGDYNPYQSITPQDDDQGDQGTLPSLPSVPTLTDTGYTPISEPIADPGRSYDFDTLGALTPTEPAYAPVPERRPDGTFYGRMFEPPAVTKSPFADLMRPEPPLPSVAPRRAARTPPAEPTQPQALKDQFGLGNSKEDQEVLRFLERFNKENAIETPGGASPLAGATTPAAPSAEPTWGDIARGVAGAILPDYLLPSPPTTQEGRYGVPRPLHQKPPTPSWRDLAAQYGPQGRPIDLIPGEIQRGRQGFVGPVEPPSATPAPPPADLAPTGPPAMDRALAEPMRRRAFAQEAARATPTPLDATAAPPAEPPQPPTIWGTVKNSLADAARVFTHPPGDLAVSVSKGLVGVTQAAISLVDMGMIAANPSHFFVPPEKRMSFGRWMNGLGYRPEEINKYLDTFKTEAQHEAEKPLAQALQGFSADDQRRVDTLTKGLVDAGLDPAEAKEMATAQINSDLSLWTHGKRWANYLKEAAKHPSTGIHAAVESIPLMLAGGWVGGLAEPAFGLLANEELAARLAAGFGEGFTQFLSAREQIRENNPGGMANSPGQELAALASGAGDMLIGMYGSALAEKFGLEDVDALFLKARKSPSTRKTLLTVFKAIPAAMIQEGFVEEFPQGIQEQFFENLAEGKPWYEGMAENAIMGMFAGAFTAAGAQGFHAPLQGAGQIAETSHRQALLQNLFGSKEEPSTDAMIALRQRLQVAAQDLRAGRPIERQGQGTLGAFRAARRAARDPSDMAGFGGPPLDAAAVQERIGVVDDLLRERLGPAAGARPAPGAEGPEGPMPPEPGQEPTPAPGKATVSRVITAETPNESRALRPGDRIVSFETDRGHLFTLDGPRTTRETATGEVSTASDRAIYLAPSQAPRIYQRLQRYSAPDSEFTVAPVVRPDGGVTLVVKNKQTGEVQPTLSMRLVDVASATPVQLRNAPGLFSNSPALGFYPLEIWRTAPEAAAPEGTVYLTPRVAEALHNEIGPRSQVTVDADGRIEVVTGDRTRLFQGQTTPAEGLQPFTPPGAKAATPQRWRMGDHITSLRVQRAGPAPSAATVTPTAYGPRTAPPSAETATTPTQTAAAGVPEAPVPPTAYGPRTTPPPTTPPTTPAYPEQPVPPTAYGPRPVPPPTRPPMPEQPVPPTVGGPRARPKAPPAPGWLGTVEDPAQRTAVTTAIAKAANEQRLYDNESREKEIPLPAGRVRLTEAEGGKQGALQRAKALNVFVRAMKTGATPEEAADQARAEGRLVADQARTRGVKLAAEGADAVIAEAVRGIREVAPLPEADTSDLDALLGGIVEEGEGAIAGEPRWKPGADPELAAEDVHEVLKRTLADQVNILVELASEKDAGKAAQLQGFYNDVWPLLDAQIAGIDVKALQQDVEAQAQARIAQTQQTAEEGKGEAAPAEKPAEKPASEDEDALLRLLGEGLAEEEKARGEGEGKGEPATAEKTGEGAPAAPAGEKTEREQIAEAKAEAAKAVEAAKAAVREALRGLGTQTNVGVPIDGKLLKAILGLARAYAKQAGLTFREAALDLRETFGSNPQVDRAFERAWPMAELEAKNPTWTPEQIAAAVPAEVNRLKVADIVAAEPAKAPTAVTPAQKGGVIAFRSGNQRAITDLRGFIEAGQQVGVTALGMDDPVRDALVAHVASGGQAFIDSGAFGRTQIIDGRGVPDLDFPAVLAQYQSLAADVRARGGDPGRLLVVAPDVAPAFVDPHNQDLVVKRSQGRPRSFPEETVEIQEHYADDIEHAIQAGMTVIVPVQVGPTMAQRAVEVVQRWPGAMIGLPGNQRAISNDQLSEMLDALVTAGVKPRGFHFLGVGEESRRFQPLVKLVQAHALDANGSLLITTDASRAQSYFGTLKSGQPRKGTGVREALIDSATRALMDETEVAGDLTLGVFDAFTEQELARLRAAVDLQHDDGVTRPATHAELTRYVEEGSLEDHSDQRLDDAIWQIAYDRARAEILADEDRSGAITRLESVSPARERIIELMVSASRRQPSAELRGDKDALRQWRRARAQELRAFEHSLISETPEALAAEFAQWPEGRTDEGQQLREELLKEVRGAHEEPSAAPSAVGEGPGPGTEVRGGDAQGGEAAGTRQAQGPEEAPVAASQPATSRPAAAAPKTIADQTTEELRQVLLKYSYSPRAPERVLAQRELDRRAVEDATARGIVPGARVRYKKGDTFLVNSVRSSLGTEANNYQLRTLVDLEPERAGMMGRAGVSYPIGDLTLVEQPSAPAPTAVSQPAGSRPAEPAPAEAGPFARTSSEALWRLVVADRNKGTDDRAEEAWRELDRRAVAEGAARGIVPGAEVLVKKQDEPLTVVLVRAGLGGKPEGFKLKTQVELTTPDGTERSYDLKDVNLARGQEAGPAAEGGVAPGGPGERPAAPERGVQPEGERAPRRQSRAARERAETAAVLTELVQEAVAGGFAGDPAALRLELEDRLQLVADLDRDFSDRSARADHLLRVIAGYGGLSLKAEDPSGTRSGYTGELEWLREFQDDYGRGRHAFGTIRGVRGVLNENGLSMDDMLRMLEQNPELYYIRSLRDLTEEIAQAARIPRDDRIAAERLRDSFGRGQWWNRITLTPAVAEPETSDAIEPLDNVDITFDPAELEAQGEPNVVQAPAQTEEGDAQQANQQDDQQHEKEVSARRRADTAMVESGHVPLSRETLPGSRVTDHFTGEAGTVTEQTTDGPTIDGRALGAADADGTWGGYSVWPAKEYSTENMAEAFRLSPAEADVTEVVRQQHQTPTETLLVAKDGIAGDGALRQADVLRFTPRPGTAAARTAAAQNWSRALMERAAAGVPAAIVDALHTERRAIATLEAQYRGTMHDETVDPIIDRSTRGLLAHIDDVAEEYGVSPDGLRALVVGDDPNQRATPPRVLYQAAAPFYSRLTRAVEQTPMQRAIGWKWKGVIAKWAKGKGTPTIGTPVEGASRADYVFAHVDDLENQKEYTKQEVLDYLKANELNVVPVSLGGPEEARARFATGNFVTLGADPGTHREVFLVIPDSDAIQTARERLQVAKTELEQAKSELEEFEAENEHRRFEWELENPGSSFDRELRNLEGAVRYAEDEVDDADEAWDRAWKEEGQPPTWQDGHEAYDRNPELDNPIVRVRFHVRTQPDGRRVMFLDEVQRPSKTEHGMPALLREHAPTIGFKWALRYAAENGLDAVAWTTGETQAKRYGLDQVVDTLVLAGLERAGTPEGAFDEGVLYGFKSGQQVYARRVTADTLDAHVGPAIARELLAAPVKDGNLRRLDRAGVQVGAGRDSRGLRNLYDKVYPATVLSIPAVRSTRGTIGTETIAIPYTGLTQPHRYEGPTYTADELAAIVNGDNARYGPETPGWLGATSAKQVRSAVDALRRGQPFQQAMDENLAAHAAEALGGQMVPVGTHATATVPSLAITPQLREAVLGGQPLFQGAQGAVEFMLDGKAILRGFASANVSTALHELFHVARRQRLNRNVPEAQRGGITDAMIETFEEWAGATNGVWTHDAEEKAARGYERYLREGGISFKNPVLTKVFETIKQWMTLIYAQIAGSPLDVHVTPAVRAIFDTLLGAEVRAAAPAAQAAVSQAAEQATTVHPPGSSVQLPGRYDRTTIPQGTIAVTSENGYILATKNPNAPDYAWVNHIRVADKAQRKGEGTALYLAALKAAQDTGLKGIMRGDTLSGTVPGGTVSQAALGVWNRLAERGLTETIPVTSTDPRSGKPVTEDRVVLVRAEPARQAPPASKPAVSQPIADVLPTGETQPRLPGAEGVREQNIATPQFEAPFSLTSEVAEPTEAEIGELFLSEDDQAEGLDSNQSDLEPDLAQPRPQTEAERKLADIERRKAALSDRAQDLTRQLNAKLGQISANPMFDTETVKIILGLVKTYMEDLGLDFQKAAITFRAQWEAERPERNPAIDRKADEVFELGWATKEALKTGQYKSYSEAAAAARANPNRRRIADAVKAYTEAGGANAGPAAEPRGGVGEGRPAPKLGGRGVQPIRTTGEGPLGPVSPEPGAGIEGAGPAGTGEGGPAGGVRTTVPGGTVQSPEPEGATGAGPGAVPPVGVPTAGGVAGPTGIEGNRASDYQLTPERSQAIINRTPVQRLTDNIAALRLVKELQNDQRFATPDEQDQLAKYVGWGALQPYLAESPVRAWSKQERTLWQELRDLTTPEERKGFLDAADSAHLTYDLYQPVWNALTRFGFTDGRVIEPAVGTGHALGFMPATARQQSTITATETDPITAAISSYLYPSVRVKPHGFEQLRLPVNTQDLILTHVPYGGTFATRSGDENFRSKQRFLQQKVHGYFFAKALDYLRPGGYVVFVAPRAFMDAPENTEIRRYLMTQAHFVGAVRLPGGENGAFAQSAQTDGVHDVIVLQKFQPGETLARQADLFTKLERLADFSTPEGKTAGGRTIPAVDVYRSTWYRANPDFRLGAEVGTGGLNSQYTVERGEGDLHQQIEDALTKLLPAGTYQAATTESTSPQAVSAAVGREAWKPGEYQVTNGVVQRKLLNGDVIDATPYLEDGSIDDTTVSRIIGHIQVRTVRRALVSKMLDPNATDDQIKALQKTLTDTYAAFTKAHGVLNSKENIAAFRLDNDADLLRGLEIVEARALPPKIGADGKKRVKVRLEVVGTHDMFRERTMFPTPEITHVYRPEEGLLASLTMHGRINWAYMGKITGYGDEPVTPGRIIELQKDLLRYGLVFEQPDGSFVLPEEYLSGDVVSKLADAKAAEEEEPDRFQHNVEELTRVQPAPKKAEDIQVFLGQHWLEPADMARFVDEMTGGTGTTLRLDGSEQYIKWTGEFPDNVVAGGENHGLAVEYGNPKKPPKYYGITRMMNDALNLRQPTLSYSLRIPGSKKSINVPQPEATAQARANLEVFKQQFVQWVHSNPDVLERAVKNYNERLNRTAPRQFDGTHLTNYRQPTNVPWPSFFLLNQLEKEQGGRLTPQSLRTPALPGLALDFRLYDHQLRGAWRILSSGNTLLAHEVGAGKTFEMIIAAMEMRRTGRARKPLITVPSYLLAQWRADIMKAYPSAKLLAFDEKDLRKGNRQEAMTRIAHGDWDIVLIPHHSFLDLKVSDEHTTEVLQQWVDELLAAAHALRGELGTGPDGQDHPTVKRLFGAAETLANRAEKLKAGLKPEADTEEMTWDRLGVDALFIDEAHAFKNLYFNSKMDRIRGLSRNNANKSLDLAIKVKTINEASNYNNLVFGTATPLMNSLAEIYTMQRYLQPQRLRELGFENFDNWYATFASAQYTTERKPDGTYQEVLRIGQFRNAKLLHRIASEMMDYVGWEDMLKNGQIKLPGLVGGKVQIVRTEQHPMYPVLKKWFSVRLAAIKKLKPRWDAESKTYIAPDRFHPITGERMKAADGKGWAKDNILTIMNDAALAAVDVRLLLGDHAKDFAGSRVQQVAKQVAEFYKRETPNKGAALLYLDVGTPKNVEPMEFLGGAEVVDETGSELGLEDDVLDPEDEDAAALQAQEGNTSDSGFNLYDSIKKALIARGVKSSEIAYIHQARDNAERQALYAAVRDGRVRVLLASTDKGGLGMNIQKRLGLEIHVDPPRARRPGDVRQRDGRIIRAGNTYPEVEIARYVTKGSTDEFNYGLLGRKQNMLTQWFGGQLDEAEEEDEATIAKLLEASFGEGEAMSADDPRVLELVTLSTQLPRIQAQAVAADKARTRAQDTLTRATRRLEPQRTVATRLGEWIANSFQTIAGDQFEISIGNREYTHAGEANTALLTALEPLAAQARRLASFSPNENWQTVGEVRGLQILARPRKVVQAPDVEIAIDADAAGEGEIQVAHIDVTDGPFGENRRVVQSIQTKYNNFPDLHRRYLDAVDDTERELAQAQRTLEQTPDYGAQVTETQRRIAEIESEFRRESAIREAEAEAERQRQQAERNAQAPATQPPDRAPSLQPDRAPSRTASDRPTPLPTALQEDLRALGYDQREIDLMTPEEAAAAIAGEAVQRVDTGAPPDTSEPPKGPDDDGPPPLPPDGDHSVGDHTVLQTDKGPVVVPHAIEFPELVTHIVKPLLNNVPGLKDLESKTRGFFDPASGKIVLNRELFKKGNEVQLAKTLAHEIGHVVDWLPDYILKRGNLLGHLRTLVGFVTTRYTSKEDSSVVEDRTVRRELTLLSMAWREWVPGVSKSYDNYRKQPTELYADAISALLNDPGVVEREAPTFFKEFMAELDRKPTVRDAFFAMWSIMSGTRQELMERAEANRRRMYQKGNDKAIDILRLKRDQRKLFNLSIVERIRQLPFGSTELGEYPRVVGEELRKFQRDLRKNVWVPFKQFTVDKHSMVVELRRNDQLAQRAIAEEEDPFYALSERPYLMAGRQRAWLEETVQPILASLRANKLTWDDLGALLLYERIAQGDRVELANPEGITPQRAAELHEYMRAQMTPEQWDALQRNAVAFRDAVKEVAFEAYQAGLYTKEIWNTINKNQYYATFHTIEHLADGLTSRIFTQKGTLKEVRNPADATAEKVLVTIRAIVHQRAKVTTINWLRTYHPGDIVDAKKETILAPDGQTIKRPKAPPRNSGLELVTYYRRGRMEGVWVHPYLAQSMNNYTIFGNSNWLLPSMNKVVKGLYTTYNVGYQATNLIRDFMRLWVNLPAPYRRELLKRYWKARHLAAVRVWGLASPEASKIRQVYRTLRGRDATSPTATEEQAYKDLLAAEKAGILSTTYSEHLERPLEGEMILNILASYGVGRQKLADRSPAAQAYYGFFKGLENLGNFIETLPKGAGLYEFQGDGRIEDITPAQRQFIRAAIGSPDFLAGGTGKNLINNTLLFSNAQIQGWRTDLNLARDPETLGGYWMRSAAVNFMPKLLMKAAMLAAKGAAVAAVAGAAGGPPDDDDTDAMKAVKRMLARVPWLVSAGQVLLKVGEYDLANKIVIPFGFDAKGQARVVKLQQEDTGRFLGGLFWKGLNLRDGDRNFWAGVMDLLDYTAGQMPSPTPIISAALTGLQYARGQMPRDTFRQRDVITAEQQAGRPYDTNNRALKRFLAWEWAQAGGDLFYRAYDTDERPVASDNWQHILGVPYPSSLKQALQVPVLGTNIASRFVGVTDAGEGQHLRLAGQAYAGERAVASQEQRLGVNAALKQYFDLPRSQQTLAKQDQIARTLVRNMYPQFNTYDEKTREDLDGQVKTKMRLSVIHGKEDVLADRVMSAQTNGEKVTIIMAGRPYYGLQEFDRWLFMAQHEKIISPGVAADVKQRLRQKKGPPTVPIPIPVQ